MNQVLEADISRNEKGVTKLALTCPHDCENDRYKSLVTHMKKSLDTVRHKLRQISDAPVILWGLRPEIFHNNGELYIHCIFKTVPDLPPETWMSLPVAPLALEASASDPVITEVLRDKQEMKLDILKKFGYIYDLTRNVYHSRNVRKIFSYQAIQDNSLEWLKERIAIRGQRWWRFFMTEELSDNLRDKILRSLYPND